MMPETERTLEERVAHLEKLVDSQEETIDMFVELFYKQNELNGQISEILEFLLGKETSKK